MSFLFLPVAILSNICMLYFRICIYVVKILKGIFILGEMKFVIVIIITASEFHINVLFELLYTLSLCLYLSVFALSVIISIFLFSL